MELQIIELLKILAYRPIDSEYQGHSDYTHRMRVEPREQKLAKILLQEFKSGKKLLVDRKKLGIILKEACPIADTCPHMSCFCSSECEQMLIAYLTQQEIK